MARGGSREHKRFMVDDCDVQVQAHSLPGFLSRGALYPVVNLGIGGIQFISFKPFKLGQRLSLSVKVGEQFGYIRATAVAHWSDAIPGERAFRMGAGFVKLPKGEADKLLRMEEDYWPRQAEIQEHGIRRLKLPPSVAQKLSIMIRQAGQRHKYPSVMLMPGKGMSTHSMGTIGDLTRAQVGHGRWIDTARGLVFKDPEESFGDRRAKPHGPTGDTEEIQLPDAGLAPPDEPLGELVEPAEPGDLSEPEPLDHAEAAAHEAGAASAPLPGDTPPPDASAGAADATGEQAGEDEQLEPSPTPLRAERPAIPLFVLGSSRQLAIDTEGRPIESCAATMTLPGLGPGHFACRLADDSMMSSRDKRFKLGDIVVFSMSRKPADRCYAFVATQDTTTFRQIFFGPDGMVMLRPLNPGLPVAWIHERDVLAMWPSVARIQHT